MMSAISLPFRTYNGDKGTSKKLFSLTGKHRNSDPLFNREIYRMKSRL